jgi:hypothetical protein
MAEIGHEDSKTTLNLYAKAMRYQDDQGEKDALRTLVEGGVLAAKGSNSENGLLSAGDTTDQTALESA